MPEEKQPPIEQNTPQTLVATPSLRDKRGTPEGVVPKQAQAYVIAGLAILILLAALFSKNHAKPSSTVPPAQVPSATDANARKIEELKESLSSEQIQAKRLSQKQTQNAVGENFLNSAGSGVSQASAAPAAQLPSAVTEPQRDPITDAERELAFKARFASNLITNAASSRTAPTQDDGGATTPLNEAAFPARSSSLPSQTVTAAQPVSAAKRAPEVNINSATGQPYVLFEGATIDTVLVNRLDGEFVGPVKVMASNPVYSHDGQHVLIPEGTFILGEAQRVTGFGQKRLSVAFHRMLMPDGYSVDLDQFHGLDQTGATGLKGKIDNHYVEIFGASIALGIIAGAAESTTNSGNNTSGSDAYRQGVASSLSQSSANVLDRFINILPTHTIFEGHRVKVYLTQDMLLPAYENHSMPEVF